MINKRSGVFETNSSSTHSVTMCTKEQYEDFVSGKLLYNEWGDSFINRYKEVPTEELWEEAKNIYNQKKESFWKEWEDIDADSKEKFFEKAEHILCVDPLLENSYEYESYQSWVKHHSNLDMFHKEFKTPNGENMVAFGYYGYDG